MSREQAQRDTSRARGGGALASARRGSHSGAALPVQMQLLLSLQRTAGNRAVSGLVQQSIQRKQVSDDHVGDDLNHGQAERLFTEGTMDWWSKLPAASKSSAKNREASVRAGRANVDYQQLRNTTLKSAQTLRSWLGKEAHEYMYVHEGSNIYTGGRDREKLPHPTLVGGDPDATCAGTMQLDRSKKTVTITNESGHFRPSSVATATVEFVRDLLPKSSKGKGGYKVKTREV